MKAVFVKLLEQNGYSSEDALKKVDAILGHARNSHKDWRKTLMSMLHQDKYALSKTGWMQNTGITLNPKLIEQMLQGFNEFTDRNKELESKVIPQAILPREPTNSTPSNTLPVQPKLSLTTEGLNLAESANSDSESTDSQTPSSHRVKIGFELKTIYPENEEEADALIRLVGTNKATKQSYSANELTFKLTESESKVCTLEKISDKEVDFCVSEGSLTDFIGQLDQMVHALLTQKRDFRPSSIDLSKLRVTTDDELKEINKFIANLKNHNIKIELPEGVNLETKDQTTGEKKMPPSLVFAKVASGNQVKKPAVAESPQQTLNSAA